MDERAVLTTGANSGIGLATAIALARKGFTSYGSVRSDEKAAVLKQAADEAGVEVRPLILDVTDEEQCERALTGLRLYGLVNNAGYAIVGAIEDVEDDEARQLLETMVIAPMRLARLALPSIREQRGRIVNVSSIAGRAVAPFAGWYSAAKHALEALSDALRMEVAGDGVKVVLVEPGGFRTGIWEEYERDINRREADGSRFAGAYRRSLQAQRLVEGIMGDPAGCAKVIVGAMSSRSPRARYLVGLDAVGMNLAEQLTPTAIKDRAIRLTLGI